MKEKVFNDLKQAMRNKDALTKGVLTLLKAGLDAAEKEKGAPLTDIEANAIVQRELKQTNQALEGAVKARRDDLIINEHLKIALLKGYLLEQMDEEQAKSLLIEAGIKAGMNMGEAMKIAKAELTGKIDNGLLAKITKALISEVQ